MNARPVGVPGRWERRLLWWGVLAALLVSGIAPRDRLTWLMETLWVIAALPPFWLLELTVLAAVVVSTSRIVTGSPMRAALSSGPAPGSPAIIARRWSSQAMMCISRVVVFSDSHASPTCRIGSRATASKSRCARKAACASSASSIAST